jgi:HD-GYP domain-containing protein (c-di-GMP phosphodiesterase class II)
MSQTRIQLEATPRYEDLRRRLRDLGLLLVTCDAAGELDMAPPIGRDWLSDLLCRAPIVIDAVRRLARRWENDDAPAVAELLPGLWVAPNALVNRRRVVGYMLTLIPTPALLEAEQLRAMCQASKLDFELSKRLLVQLNPVPTTDLDRIASMIRFAQEDQTRLTKDGTAVESVSRQLAESYEEISLLYTIIQSMTVGERPDRFVTIACEELLGTLPYSWIGVKFADNSQHLKRLSTRFIFAGESSATQEQLDALAQTMFERAQPNAPIVLEPTRNPADTDFAPFGQTTLVHPISTEDTVIGLLIAGDKQGADTAASSVDMKLLGATASHTAIFLHNLALYDDLNAMFLGTLEALSAAIDAKDRYTCGHSERVAHLTQQLARAVGLGEDAVERAHIAGIVHDVGKIGVPESVLLKPGKLNDEEFAWIRKHPEIGHRILKDIPQLDDILPGVLHHHERYDGRGYPAGLAGTDIPYIARLITLADSFDAMSSTRTYRTGMSRDEVLAEVARCAGTQFDPELAPIFVKLDFAEYDRLVAEHQALEPTVPHQLDEESAA